MSSDLGCIQKLLVVVISTALASCPVTYAQGVGDRDAKTAEKVREQVERSAQDAAQALRDKKYMSFDKLSFGEAAPEAQRYTRRIFNEFESDLITREVIYNGALELRPGPLILHRYSDGRLETRLASLPLRRAELPTLLAARRAFEPSWADMFAATIVSFIPRDESEYSALFPGATPSRSAIDQMAKIRDAGGLPAMSTLSDFNIALGGSDNDLVIVIAHNDNGEFVRWGGFKVKPDDLSKECAKLLKLCIFLPCNAKTFTTDPSLPAAQQDIDPLEAVKLARTIARDASETGASLQNSSLRPHPATVVERYIGFMENVLSRIEKMGGHEKTWWRVMLVPTKGSVVPVVAGLLVKRDAAN
jgi:hypothetical protein